MVRVRRKGTGPLQVGEELVVEMPGPWDGPVRVVQVDDGCLRLATLQGHLEAGQVRFRALERSGVLVFEVEARLSGTGGATLVDYLGPAVGLDPKPG